MYSRVVLSTLAIATLAAAHGKVSVFTGNLGGNGTALGIRGGVVPGAGPNSLTEVDTTVFWSKDIRTDADIGYTDEAGNNQLEDLTQVMKLSGDVIPQISSGGSVSGTYHIVTSDGAGPLEALIDETATAKWSTAKSATVSTQPAGEDGFISPSGDSSSSNTKRSRVYGKLSKRAVNINEDYPFTVEIPAGTSCTGTINGYSNLCLVKVSNNNKNGPFGGVLVVQMSSNSTASTTSTTSSAARTSSSAAAVHAAKPSSSEGCSA